eukprot:4741789-Pyramimonas_sp.AAC.1
MTNPNQCEKQTGPNPNLLGIASQKSFKRREAQDDCEDQVAPLMSTQRFWKPTYVSELDLLSVWSAHEHYVKMSKRAPNSKQHRTVLHRVLNLQNGSQ